MLLFGHSRDYKLYLKGLKPIGLLETFLFLPERNLDPPLPSFLAKTERFLKAQRLFGRLILLTNLIKIPSRSLLFRVKNKDPFDKYAEIPV